MNPEDRIRNLFADSIAVKQRALEQLPPSITAAAEKMIQILKSGGKIMSCGNGDSAADAQHFSSELINRFDKNMYQRAMVFNTIDAH